MDGLQVGTKEDAEKLQTLLNLQTPDLTLSNTEVEVRWQERSFERQYKFFQGLRKIEIPKNQNEAEHLKALQAQEENIKMAYRLSKQLFSTMSVSSQLKMKTLLQLSDRTVLKLVGNKKAT